GIGSFYLDDVVDVQDISDKNAHEFLEHIHFAQKKITTPDDALIDFIRKNTGKIKPLAESDLDTYVADGKLMLNIGKPFHIEGIGQLQKNKDGVYEFTAGEPTVQRLEPLSNDWDTDKSVRRKSVYEDNPYEARNISYRRIAIGAGIVLGLAIVIWGGYSLYSSKTAHTAPVANATVSGTGDTTQHTSQYVHDIDSP